MRNRILALTAALVAALTLVLGLAACRVDGSVECSPETQSCDIDITRQVPGPETTTVPTTTTMLTTTTTPVPPPNQAPTGNLTFGCDGLTCTFSGGGSSDPDGSITAYSWSFGDGGSSSGVNVSHTFSAAGNYSVTLTVHDDGGAADSTTQTITVTGG